MTGNGQALALYDDARRLLAEAARVDEVKALRNKAEAVALYARQAKDGELLANAIEIRLRAERRAGELLAQMARRGERAGRGGDQKSKSPQGTLITLEKLGVSRKESSRWQELAEVAADEFEARIAARKRQAIAAVELSREEKQAAKKQARAQREKSLGEKQSALPDRRYGVIYADIEARFDPYSRESGMDRAPENHYPTSDWHTLAARDVASIAAQDCVLFSWAWMPNLPRCLDVMSAWGFAYKSHAVWVKDKIGGGYWFRQKHELLLVGTRGDVPAPAQGDQFESVFVAPRGAHSEKPDCVLEMIEALYPNLPKIELNRRGPARPGWDAWGNEAEASEA